MMTSSEFLSLEGYVEIVHELCVTVLTELIYNIFQDLFSSFTRGYCFSPSCGSYADRTRRFYMTTILDNCPGHIGWMVVADVLTSYGTPDCSWELGIARPAVLYTPCPTSDLYSNRMLGK
jgi:hypothetical protein